MHIARLIVNDVPNILRASELSELPAGRGIGRDVRSAVDVLSYGHWTCLITVAAPVKIWVRWCGSKGRRWMNAALRVVALILVRLRLEE